MNSIILSPCSCILPQEQDAVELWRVGGADAAHHDPPQQQQQRVFEADDEQRGRHHDAVDEVADGGERQLGRRRQWNINKV